MTAAKTTTQKPQCEKPWISYAYGNGVYAAVDVTGILWTSTNGYEWTKNKAKKWRSVH